MINEEQVNKERVRLLVGALRSGQRIQGQMVLEAEYADGTVKNCCLGVACRVAMENGLPVEITREYGDNQMFNDDVEIVLFDGQDDVLPASVRNWYGFVVDNPYLKHPEFNEELISAADANDTHEMSFDTIADAFERTYLT